MLRAVFRGKLLEMTRRAYAEGRLCFQGDDLDGLNCPEAFEKHLRTSLATDWVVHAKPPFGCPKQVLKYLANYTHRVAISNHRLLSMREGKVRFRWRDYARGNRKRVMALDAGEFMRRFLLHTLPRRFVRIRHFGFLANTSRKKKLARCRELIGCQPPAPPEVTGDDPTETERLCPRCELGHLVRSELLPSLPRQVSHHRRPVPIDSS